MSLSTEATHTFFLGRSTLSGILTHFACSLPLVWLHFVWCLILPWLLLLWWCRWKIILLQALSYLLLLPLCGQLSWQVLCICPSPPTLSAVSHPLSFRHLLIMKRAGPFSAIFHCDLAAVFGSICCSSGRFKLLLQICAFSDNSTFIILMTPTYSVPSFWAGGLLPTC